MTKRINVGIITAMLAATLVAHAAANFVELRQIRILLAGDIENHAACRPGERLADRVLREIECRHRDR